MQEVRIVTVWAAPSGRSWDVNLVRRTQHVYGGGAAGNTRITWEAVACTCGADVAWCAHMYAAQDCARDPAGSLLREGAVTFSDQSWDAWDHMHPTRRHERAPHVDSPGRERAAHGLALWELVDLYS